MGGTEIYVLNLVRELRLLGVDGFVVAPGSTSRAYEAEGVSVRRFAGSASLPLADLYGAGDPSAAREFGKALDAIQPDLVHFHAYTSASSLLALREARRRELPVLLTYHTPTLTCARGTLLELGRSICDGRMQPVRCTQCVLQGKGVAIPLAA
ncbi:MAG: glycosyltransferase, partial [Terriglobia bacterium]